MRLPNSVTHRLFRVSLASALSAFIALVGVIFVSPSIALSGPRIVSTPDETTVSEVSADEADASTIEDVTDVPAEPEAAVATTIIVNQPGDPPAEPRRARVVARRHRDVTGFEVGVRVGSFSAGQDWIDPEGTANYGGFGMAMRWRFDEDWSIEAGFDGVHRNAETDAISESRFLFNLGALYYFGRPDWWQSYLSFGFMGSETEISGPNAISDSYGEAGAYVGFGADFYVDNWRLNTELRLAGLGRDEEDFYPRRPEQDYHRTASDGRGAVQWFFGALYSF